MQLNPVYTADAGFILAVAAVMMLFFVVLFGDLFLTSERAVRRWMTAFTWCVAGGLFATAAAAVWAVAQLNH